MFKPSLKEGQQKQQDQREENIDIRREGANPRENQGDFIDYEEVE